MDWGGVGTLQCAGGCGPGGNVWQPVPCESMVAAVYSCAGRPPATVKARGKGGVPRGLGRAPEGPGLHRALDRKMEDLEATSSQGRGGACSRLNRRVPHRYR